ncbi:ribonuclease T [Sphingomonas ginsenosidivorax]|uniref:Ribonuclease T n=1 Tax=Sphingomonas ginsenosidivorax TaxID=862135 RepID=A0A5C6UBG3_9SPHN|nr:ribonuclease T [Sphingomonas ginsenosidivorax]TXC70143.1 ribonuclease T [Sphingomonas ginsenosidivorax]
MIRLVIAATALLAPGIAGAQAYSCSAPTGALTVHPDLPSAEQPARDIPIGSYTLAITWAPQYCRDNAGRPASAVQCGGGNRFGFTLHGLWPDGVGKTWPQYCKAAGIVPQPVLRKHLCATPSAQLMQHEWAKHGTCMPGYRPAKFFAQSGALYARLRYPDMDALSRAPLTAGRFANAMARANPGLGAQMMRITATRQGWLDEVWICLDRRFRYRRCPVHQGGLAPAATLKIWRGAR